MKKSMRVLAMILAVVFAVYGFPMVPTSAEEDAAGTDVTNTAPNEETVISEEPSVIADGEDLTDASNMKFVQTDFDSETGLLTMTLRIKPTTNSYQDGVYTGTHMSEGFFAFSFDPDSVVPYTVKTENGELVPDTDLLAINGTMEYVGGGSNSAAIFQNFINSENTRGHRVNSSFNAAMGESRTRFDDTYSGLFVSAARMEETGLMDCYLQYRIITLSPDCATIPEADGYVNVVNVYFQCYSTSNDGTQYDTADSDDELFCSSIQIPDTASEAQALTNQFYTMKDDPTSPNLALGVAGYVERNLEWTGTDWAPGPMASNYYYYLDNERIEILKNTSTDEFKNYFWQVRNAWSNGITGVMPTEKTPYLYFKNSDKKYLLEGFTASNANTFDSQMELEAGLTPEFYRPKEETYYYPRYSVPTGEQNDDNDIAKDWRPLSYVPAGVSAAPQKVELKYDIRTEVSDKSISNPETEDLEKFLGDIKWEFALRDGTPLNGLASTEIAGSGTEIEYYRDESAVPSVGYVVEAKLDGGSYLVWNIYESRAAYEAGDDKLMTTPVGVLMELAESDIIVRKMDREDDSQTPTEDGADSAEPGVSVQERGLAPQLHVTNAAADVRSYLWNDTEAAYNGVIVIKATYSSEVGIDYAVDATTVKLYKETPEPAYTTLDVREVGEVTNDEGTDVTGFETSLSDDLTVGIPVYSYVYDQYYTRMDKSFSTLTFETEETIPTGKANVFDIVQDTTDKNKYYITYGKSDDGMTYNVNEAVGGLYTLSAICERADVATEDIFVKREDDKLTYIDVVTSKGTAGTLGGKEVVYVEVPALDSNGNARTDSIDLNISVLANQWYQDSDPQQASRYDIAYGIRGDSGFVDLSTARAKDVVIDFEADYAPGTDVSRQKGVDGADINSGTLRYNTTVADNVEYCVTVSATYDGVTVSKEFSIIFTHEQLALNKIEITGLPDIIEVNPSKTTTVTLGTQVRDQYGQVWSWDGVEDAYEPGGRLNLTGTQDIVPWAIELADGSTLPDDGSIRMAGSRKETITVTSAAENSTIKVNAVFKVPDINSSGDDFIFRSATYTINIRRNPSKPTEIELSYGMDKFIPGAKSASGSANNMRYTPTVTVKDQYGATMSASDYELDFSLRAVGSTDNKVYLDRTVTEVDGEQVENIIGEKTGVIVVEERAMNCTIELTLIAVGKNADGSFTGSTEIRKQIPVERAAANVSEISIQNTSVTYPETSEPASYSEQLVAVGETQYGEGEEIASNLISWELVSVTVNGTKHTGSSAAGKGINLNNSTGVVTFDRTIFNRSSVPSEFEVELIYRNNSALNVTKALPVNISAAEPSSVVLLESSYIGGIDVPSAEDSEDSITITGDVRDQYGLRMPDAKLTWSITGHDPATNASHVKIDKDTGELTVSYAADGGYATVKAEYTKDAVTVSQSIDVKIIAPGQVPTYVTFRQLKNSSTGATVALEEHTDDPSNENIVTSTTAEIPLPGKLDGSVTYDLSGRVLDQSLKILAGETITWTVDASDNKTNAAIDANGRLTVNYTDAARDATDGKSTIKLVATAGGTARGELIITVKKEEDKATYAEPAYEVQKDSEGNDRVNTNGQALVPSRTQEDTVVKYTAKVYSQYGQVMTGEKATMKLLTSPGTALTFTSTAEGATLRMNYSMRGSVVEVAAYADGNPDFTVPASTVRLTVDPGTSYAYALVLGSSAAGDDNQKTVSLPYWQTTAVGNVSSEVTYNEYEFDALVIDQSDTPFADAQPVWEIAAETDADGNPVLPDAIRLSSKNTFKSGSTTQVVGNRVIVEVGSTAVTPEELSKVIKLNVWTEDRNASIGSTPYSDASYKKTLSFTVRRDAAAASYLYFSSTDDRNAVTAPDVDANGNAEFNFPRPTTAEVSKVYTLSPKVFDQYGFHITEEFVQMDLDYSESSSLATGYQIVTTYARGESADDGYLPETYAIWKLPASAEGEGPTPTVADTNNKVPAGSVLMAEFNTKTGELKLYSSCTITDFKFSAHSATLSTSKNITVQLSEEERAATTVEIVRGYNGNYTIRKNSAEDILENISAVIYDQYGERYTKTDIVVDWYLKLADSNEDGELDAYVEYEEDGVTPKAPENYLVLLSNPTTAETSKQITIQGEQFESSTTVILLAQLRRRNYTQPLDILTTSNIVMRTPASGGAYASLYFEAGGKYGKLVGPSMISVQMGEYPDSIPGVKTIEGYGFFGWTSDGYTLVDPLKMPVVGDVVYYAVYRDISDTAFIDGYKDKTFKPNDNITRAEYLKMVVEATCPDFDLEGKYTSPFTDVDPDMWYAKYIGYAYSKGLVDGYEDNSFKPENFITRTEAVKLLADAAAMPEVTETADFSDLNPSRWYTIYINILYSLGIIDGYPDGTFRPNDNVTRAEAAKLVVSVTPNALSELSKRNIIENAYCPFTDIRRNHWAYAYILRAAGVA